MITLPKMAAPFGPGGSVTLYPLRRYTPNSLQAMARILVLALLADGRLDKREFASLEKQQVYATLGLSREDFIAVLLDFCSDVAKLPASRGDYLISPHTLQALLAEISHEAARRRLLQQMIETAWSDGTLAEGEQRLLRHAAEAWQLNDTSRYGIVHQTADAGSASQQH